MKYTAYQRWLLTALLCVLAFNYVDRLALGLVLQDIKLDLHLTDVELGFLSGIAFALFYSLMGIPLARWADRGNRVTIIAVTTVAWTIMVALCGAAVSFAQLLLVRVGVAIGEAGCIPPAHSLIADEFARAERPRAVSIYMLGGSFSGLIGYFVAGWLNQLYGWRWMFVILSLPGLVLAAMAWFTLREPRRDTLGASTITHTSPESAPAAKEVWTVLWSNATFRHLLFAFSVTCFFGYGIAQWQPSFFVRTYGLETGELGMWLAVISGVGGIVGTYGGGEWAYRRAANNERLQLKVMAAVCCSFGIISSFIYLTNSRFLAFLLLGLATAGIATVSGPVFATIQTLVPPRMRATAISVIYLFSNLIGMGLGPLLAGALSDALRPWAGEQSLRYALLALCPGYLWGAWHLWKASQSVVRDLQADRSSVPALHGVGQ